MKIRIDRTWVDKAPALWTAYLEADKKLTPKARKIVEEIALSRDAINREIEKLAVERRNAVERRTADSKMAAELGKTCLALQTDIDLWKKELPDQRSRLVELRKTRAEAVKRRDNAIKVAQQREQEMAQLMGRDGAEVPWSDRPVPELDPRVREWAENFIRIKREKTIAFFKAESEKFGALIDLGKVNADIAATEQRISELETSIEQATQKAEELARERERAEKAGPQNHEAVLSIQRRIDTETEKLKGHDYADHLNALVGQAREAASAAVRAAVDEARENLTAILSAIRTAFSVEYFDKAKKKFTEFETLWKDRTEALNKIRPGSDVSKDIGLVTEQANLIQGLATAFESFASTTLVTEAEKVRLATLRGGIRRYIVEDVTTRRNAETGEDIKPERIYIIDDVIKAISAKCEAGSPLVPEGLLGPLWDAAEVAYTRALDQTLKNRAEESKNQEEQRRLDALDAIGTEDEFRALKASRAKATIGRYKSQPKDTFTHDDVREALRAELRSQMTPSKARWRAILGLPSKAFYDAAPFTDASGTTYKVHTSFFDSALGSASNGGVGVYKSEGTKYTPDEVMELLFEDGIEYVLRAHATLELETGSGLKPHVYVGGSHLYFSDVFDEKIRPSPTHDTNWCNRARAHCAEVLDAKMRSIRALVANWLNKDGAV